MNNRTRLGGILEKTKRRDMVHEKPVVRKLDEEKAEVQFLAAGHEPQHPNCDHKQYDPNQHGRACPCGTAMWDPGD